MENMKTFFPVFCYRQTLRGASLSLDIDLYFFPNGYGVMLRRFCDFGIVDTNVQILRGSLLGWQRAINKESQLDIHSHTRFRPSKVQEFLCVVSSWSRSSSPLMAKLESVSTLPPNTEVRDVQNSLMSQIR